MAEKKDMPPEIKEKLRVRFNEEWRKELRKSVSAKERMKLPRQKMPERDPDERNQDFLEVNLGLTEKLAKVEAKRCLDCANPQCVMGCPVGIDIPTFVKLLEIGDYEQSVRKLKETNVLPAICGRVCPQETQCEEVCNLKKATKSLCWERALRD
jgi:glutamate synthase (NADPH/NADH) small chain